MIMSGHTTDYTQKTPQVGTVGEESNSKAVFNFGLVWRGIEDLALRAAWSQGFRAPTILILILKLLIILSWVLATAESA